MMARQMTAGIGAIDATERELMQALDRRGGRPQAEGAEGPSPEYNLYH